MKTKETLATLALFAVTYALPVLTTEAALPASGEAISADTVLRQMSKKLSAAGKFSFKARREMEPDLAGGDGLHGKAEIAVAVQRPDKVVASATILGDIRRLYFDGKQLSLVDEKKNVYATVPMAASLDQLPSELSKIYGFTPPLAEFLISDPYQDLTWRAQSVEHRGMGTIKTGFLGLKRVRCHRLGLTGKHADSELWIAVNDLLPRRWNSKLKGSAGDVEIRLELSKWNLEAKTRDADFVFSPGKGALQVPMMTEAEMAAARKAAK
jgi:hypothetical protein